MNEFEWLKQTRALNELITPRSDLWPSIANRLTSIPQAPSHGPRLLPWATAASLAAISLLAGTLALRQYAVSVPPLSASAIATATTPWKPHDPRLVGAAIELNIARRELLGAIRQAPQDTYLQHMLLDTNMQVARLQKLEQRAG